MLDFGKKVKIALIEQGKNQTWLVEEVAKKTGLYIDSAYMSRILSGLNRSPKIVNSICEILDIQDDETNVT